MPDLPRPSDRVAPVSRARRDLLGEGPLWSVSQDALFWVDILGKRLNRLALADGAVAEWSLPEMTGWVIERRDAEGFVAGMQSGVKLLTLNPLAVTRFADLPDEPEDNRMNDAKADAGGRIWAGTMPVGGNRPTGSFYRIDPDATVTRVDSGYTVANGPAIDPAGTTLYHTDSGKGRVYRFALNDDGTLGPRELFVQFERDWGSPDGMTFDADGGLWIAHWGGARVSRFDPDGRVERAIPLPASQITSMAFAGPSLDRMFVTSAADGVDEELGGALFEVDAGVRGVAPHRFV